MFSASRIILKNISSVVLNVKQRFARLVRWRIVAKGVRPVDLTLTLDRNGARPDSVLACPCIGLEVCRPPCAKKSPWRVEGAKLCKR